MSLALAEIAQRHGEPRPGLCDGSISSGSGFAPVTWLRADPPLRVSVSHVHGAPALLRQRANTQLG